MYSGGQSDSTSEEKRKQISTPDHSNDGLTTKRPPLWKIRKDIPRYVENRGEFLLDLEFLKIVCESLQ